MSIFHGDDEGYNNVQNELTNKNMSKKYCGHGKYLNDKWVSFFNQIDSEFEECCVCGLKRRNPLPDYSYKENIDDMSDNGEAMEEVEARVDIDLALKRLSPKQREVAEYILEGYTLKETAEELGIAEGTVWGYFSRIKKKYGKLFGTNLV